MPVADGGFVGFPAEEDFAALVECGEVEHAAGGVAELDADLFEFFHEVFEALGAGVELFLEEGAVARRGAGDDVVDLGVAFEAEFLDVLDVGDDFADQGKGAARLVDGEVTFADGLLHRTTLLGCKGEHAPPPDWPIPVRQADAGGAGEPDVGGGNAK